MIPVALLICSSASLWKLLDGTPEVKQNIYKEAIQPKPDIKPEQEPEPEHGPEPEPEPTRVAGWGFCNDRNAFCAAWAREGQCASNEIYMTTECPHSCGACTHRCRDESAHCAGWARGGFCSENPRFMRETCPTSCGFCMGKCFDRDDQCAQWAREGQCVSNSDFMLLTCPVTCDLCTRACVDLHNDCPGWAEDGQCHANPGMMLKVCPRACAVCARALDADKDEMAPASDAVLNASDLLSEVSPGLPCKDYNRTQCAIWGVAECEQNPRAVVPLCPETCGACTTICADAHPSCRSWADSGECNNNPEFMKRTCPGACGVCHVLEKDEL